MAMTLDDIKKLSPRMRMLLVGMAFLLIAYFYWSFSFSSLWETRGTLKTKYEELSRTVDEKQKIANQKQKYINEVNLLKQKFQIAMLKLPEKKEMPFLLKDIALAGKSAGVESVLFEPIAAPPPDLKGVEKKAGAAGKGTEQKPGEEKEKKTSAKPADGDKFYEDIPIKMTVVGQFHSIVHFFERIAKLSRIVNIEEISMEESKDSKGKSRLLNTTCTLMTYTFLEKKNEQAKNATQK
jgi:type IV pilus assembly protein PilO